MIINDISDNV